MESSKNAGTGRGPVLSPQHTLQRRDCYTDRDVREKSVVDPIPGEADYLVDVLHGTNSVQCQWALGPIGQGRCS